MNSCAKIEKIGGGEGFIAVSFGRIALATVAIALSGAGWAFDAEYTAAQTVTISSGGSYLVSGTGGGAVTIAANVTGAELTISNVTWTGGATTIDIGDGASLSLILEGTSSITQASPNGDIPGIKLPQTSSLAVSGAGELDIVTHMMPCIGVGPAATMGTLTMNGGTIVAHAGGPNSSKGGLSAAIGGGYSYSSRGGNGGTVVVNDGTLVAVGYSDAPGIGGGMGYSAGGGDAGSLTVNGGHVIAMTRHIGQSGWNGDYAAPAIGPGASRKNGVAHGAPGRITVTGGILEAWVERAEASCFGIARNVGQAATIPDGAGLYVTGGTVKWNHLIMDEADFAYSFANCAVGCSSGPERKLAGLWLPVDADLATLFPAGVVFEKASGETVAANSIQLADLASGNVTLNSSSPFTIVGSSATSANKIVASGSIEAALCGVNSTGSWEVPAGSTSTVYVYGGNEIKSSGGIAWTLPETGTLAFKGDGWLFCEGASLCCAIGIDADKWGTLVVDGPTVQAEAHYRSSGVGLCYSYNAARTGAGKVVVESGTLIANGRGFAPGIGGGCVYAAAPAPIGPEVVVKTNGTLYANNIVDSAKGGNTSLAGGFSAGVAIGCGVRYDNAAYGSDAGSITVDGGTLYASVANAAMPCFGIVNGLKTGVQNPDGTGSLTVKNGGKVFFRHSDFPGRYTVTIDDGTLGTTTNTAAAWVEFNSLATVTNALTIAGPVAPELATFPSFKNNPALNLATGVTITGGMLDDEWVEIDNMENVTVSPAAVQRMKTEGDRTLTRFDTLEGWINLAELTDVYDITENGVYKFYGTGASPAAIRVADGVVCTNVLYDASINVDGGSVAPLELGEGSRVFLQLMGANTMNRIGGTDGYAVIRVPDGAALAIADGAEEGEATGSLVIDETNLDVNHVVGIGEAGTDSQMGSLTIDSGNVTIHMRHDNKIHGGAAIGSAGTGSSCGAVVINGGRVDLDGPGLGPAIGAGTDNVRMGHGGNVTINGGTVIAKGYGGASAIGLAPTYGSGAVGTPGVFTMNGGTLYAYAYTSGSYGAGECGAAIGGSGTRNGTTGSTIGQVTINDGNAYLYSESANSIGCGLPQNGSEPVARAATDRVTITGGNIWAPQGIQGDAVGASGGVVKHVPMSSSLFASYPYTLDLGGSVSYTFPQTVFSDSIEHLWLPSCVCDSEADFAIVVGDEDDETPSAYTMSGGGKTVFVAGAATLSSSSALSGAGAIVLCDGAVATFDGLDFTATSGNGYNSAVVVQDGASAKIVLKGENALKRPVTKDSVIHLPAGATLTIDGGEDDYLRISQTTVDYTVGIGVGDYNKSLSMGTFILDGGNVDIQFYPGSGTTVGNIGVAVGVGAGNRNAGTVIVNGGTLLAASGALSPGIGGGYAFESAAGSGGTVVVNGGTVTAKGYGGSSGIGGGTTYGNSGVCGAGGSFTLNGGTVYAHAYMGGRYGADDRCGAAIGGPVQRNKYEVGGMGTVTVNDGTLYAYAEVGAAIGHGNTTSGTATIENGSDGAFTVKGGSVKLASGNDAALYHVAPTNGTVALPLVTVPAGRFGAPPYALEFVERNVAEGETPLSYSYHGAGYGDDGNLYFYLPYGKYRMDGRSCSVDERGIQFPGFTFIVR